MRKEIVFVGEGGQGIVLMGRIFAEASQLDGYELAFSPDYGAAARGGSCASRIVITDEPIDFPGVMTPDILVVLSQEGYNAWIFQISPEAVVFLDIDTVKIIKPAKAVHIPILATKIASELGSRMAANMVMLGVVAAVMGMVSLENLFKVVKEETGKFAEINLDALKEGYRLGKKYLMQKR